MDAAESVVLLDHWRHDLGRAGRSLWRARAFTASAVLTLALGIAGTTVMFTLVEKILLRPLPVRDQDRLLVAWKELPSARMAHWPFRSSQVETITRETRLLDRVGGVSYYGTGSAVVFENGSASYVKGASVTGAFFEVLGVEPVLGRALRGGDDQAGAENVLVITHSLWQRRYGGSPDAIGRRLTIGGQPFTIVGIMPPDLAYPRGVEAWMTLAADASTQANPAFREGVLRDVDLVARLRPGVSIEQARDELQGLIARLEAGAPADAPRGLTPVVHSFADAVVGDVRTPILVLSAAVGLVFLIATANAANLLLLRGEARRTELAVRAALGAGRGRLARELLAESLLLSLAAGLVGLAASRVLLRVVVAFVPSGLPRAERLGIEPLVVLFVGGAVLAAAGLAALAPILLAVRADLATALRSGRQTGGVAARRGRGTLVVAQVALAVTVVAAAGLLARSLDRLQGAEMGFAGERLLFVSLAPAGARPAEGERPLLPLLDEVVAQLEAVPGIDGATVVNTPPFAGTGGWDLPVFTAEGQGPAAADGNPSLNLECVLPNYFSTLQVPLVRGRAFTGDDRAGAPEVAIVSDDLAERTWPGADPIGKRLKFGRPEFRDPWRRVVGVVKATRYRELAAPRPTLYLPAPQFVMSAPLLVLRTTLPPSRVADVARARVRAVLPDVEVMRVAPFAELLAEPLARPRFSTLLIGTFAGAALLLAAIGLYAVMAAYVRQRDPEIGIRVALGATEWDVRRLVLGEGLRLAGTGAAIGLAGAVAAARVLRGLLFGVDPLDPASLLGAALLLVVVSAVACYMPARRATRLDPATVLRTT